jgi:transcription elongation factor Elf1
MIIIGTHFFCWGSQRTNEAMHCGQCGAMTPFIIKKGMRFITLFFVIPIIPISGVKHLIQCPNCGTRYETKA